MKITSIKKTSPLYNYFNAKPRDNFSCFTPEAEMIYSILNAQNLRQTSRFSPSLFCSMLQSIKDNPTVMKELSDGIFQYKSGIGQIKKNIAQYVLFDMGYSYFNFFQWNEKNYLKLKEFFFTEQHINKNLTELQNKIQSNFLEELINPNLKTNDVAMNLLDCELTIRVLHELEKFFDIHTLLKQDISIYPNTDIFRKGSDNKIITLSAFSYVQQFTYGISSNNGFYDENISNISDPLSLCIEANTSHSFSLSEFGKQILSYELMEKEEYENCIKRIILSLKENVSQFHDNMISNFIFHPDLFNAIQSSNLDENIKHQLIYDYLNCDFNLFSYINEGANSLLLINILNELPNNAGLDILDKYFKNSKFDNKEDFIINSLISGEWSKFKGKSIFKNSNIFEFDFPGLELLKNWTTQNNQEFDKDFKILHVLLHMKSEPVLKNYFTVCNQNSSFLNNALNLTDDFFNKSNRFKDVKVAVNKRTGNKYVTKDLFSMERIQEYLMKLDVKPSTQKPRSVKF